MAIDNNIFRSAAAGSNQLNLNTGLGSFVPQQQDPLLIPLSNREQSTDSQARSVGQSIFGTQLPDISEDDFESMATDNPEEVNEGALDLYGSNPEMAKILGAITKLSKDDSATEALYAELIGEKTTPEDAKKKVNSFFNLSEEDQTPVWADVAVTVGLNLLASDDPDFLRAAGKAGQKGMAVAKERGKEKRARSNLLNQLAFGVYREDEKSRKNLLTQLSKFRAESKEKQLKFGFDLAKFFQKENELSLDQSKAVSSAITSTINTVPSDLRGQAISVISKNAASLGKNSPENVPAAVYALLKDAGLDLETVDNAKNIVGADFTITDLDTFNSYKAQFPDAFKNLQFEEGKEYKVKGFSDKGKDGAVTSILSVHSPIGKPDELTRLQQTRRDMKERILALPEGSAERLILEQELGEVEGAIDRRTTPDSTMSYLFDENAQLRAITSDLGGYQASEAARLATQIDNSANNFVRAASIGDSIMRTIANQPPGQEAGVMGVLGAFSNTIGGLRGQLDAAIGFAGDTHGSDVVDRYANRGDFSHIYDSKERTITGQPAGVIFKKFDELTADRQELRSAVYDYAFALAGSRETGKLTDKDVANAMITLGGGDIADGKWFANATALVTGVQKALDLAANGLAPRWNSSMQPSIDAAVKSGEMTEDEALALYRFDPIKIVKKRSLDPDLYTRMVFDGGKVGYQSLDRYRGVAEDQEGQDPPTSGLSSKASAAITLITDINARLAGETDVAKRSELVDQVDAILSPLSQEDRDAVTKALTGGE